MRIARTIAALVVSLTVVIACSDDDDGGSATDQACEARAELTADIDDVRNDLADGNLGDAQTSFDEVRTSFDAFADAAADLAAEQRDRLSPYVDQLRTDLSAIGDVGSVEDLTTALETIQTDVQNLSAAAEGDLDC